VKLELGGPWEDGWTLPAGRYSDPAVLQAERERIFTSAWQYAGPLHQAAEPGSFFASIAGHIPVVVTRARDEELRAFVNVCRHRGHVVAQGAACRETLQCPYHAWTYGLDGALRRAPRSEREPAFDASVLSLLPVAVEAWGPFVFVNPDAGASALAETLGELPRVLAEGGVDLDRLRFHSHAERSREVNWKVALENSIACSHGLVSPYHFVWPNTTINVAPGPLNLSIERWVPAGPRTTVEVTDYFFGPDVTEKRILEVIEGGTQGSRAVPQGRLLAESEQLVAAFQRRVFEALA
jgi:nitrite reductase/ring-hydroxylating ferredoxin subunit